MRKCTWRVIKLTSGNTVFESGCGPTNCDHNMEYKYCPYCGKKIKMDDKFYTMEDVAAETAAALEKVFGENERTK